MHDAYKRGDLAVTEIGSIRSMLCFVALCHIQCTYVHVRRVLQNGDNVKKNVETFRITWWNREKNQPSYTTIGGCTPHPLSYNYVHVYTLYVYNYYTCTCMYTVCVLWGKHTLSLLIHVLYVHNVGEQCEGCICCGVSMSIFFS